MASQRWPDGLYVCADFSDDLQFDMFEQMKGIPEAKSFCNNVLSGECFSGLHH